MSEVTELHLPVLLAEVLHWLAPEPGAVCVDATVGDGGHAAGLAQCLGAQGRLVGIDWDGAALERARQKLSAVPARVDLIRGNYVRLEEILFGLGLDRVDGILFDLGVSTLQLLDPGRGFSYRDTGRLDMRMDRRLPVNARDLVNTLPPERLAEIIFRYGEERWARRIAFRIAERRRTAGPFQTTVELAEVVKAAIPAAARRTGGHPARRTFQALRLAVNRELDHLEVALPQAVRCLSPGGRLGVIAYHSLEDRLVKRFLREQSGRCQCPPELPCTCSDDEAILVVLTPRPVRPAAEEISRNPRARSARLRVALRR